MPEVPVNYKTTASAAVGGADESTFFERSLDPSILRSGTNIVAIEIHQSSASSSDLSFDFQLDATVFPDNRPPTVEAGPDLTNTVGQLAILSGRFSDDGLPNPPGVVSVRWEKVSGPGEVAFLDPTLWTTGARFSVPGDYVLKLTADDGASTVSDHVNVRVLPGVTPQPVVESAVIGGDAEPVLIFKFNTAPGWRYKIEYCDSLTDADWQVLAEYPVQSESRLITVSDPVSTERPSRFYSVVQE
jgi:hypothetical protein